jgi:hypothetical protein
MVTYADGQELRRGDLFLVPSRVNAAGVVVSVERDRRYFADFWIVTVLYDGQPFLIRWSNLGRAILIARLRGV